MAYYEAGKTGKQGYIDTSQPVWGGTSQVLSGLGGGLGCGGGWPVQVPAGTQRMNGLGRVMRRTWRGINGPTPIMVARSAQDISPDDGDYYMPSGTKVLDGSVSAQIAITMGGKVIPQSQADAGSFCGAVATQFPPSGAPSADANTVIEAWAAAGFFVLLFQNSPACAGAGGGDLFQKAAAKDLVALGVTQPNAYIYRFPSGGSPSKGFWRLYEPIAFGTSPPGSPAVTVSPKPSPGCQAGYNLDPLTSLCWPGGLTGQGIPSIPIQLCPDGTISLDGTCPPVVIPANTKTGGATASGEPLSNGAKLTLAALLLLGGYLLLKD